MARFAPAALVAALLVATALAFAYTEQLKLTPSPILSTTVTKVFSPACGCDTDAAVIAFRLRKADRLEIDIVDKGGDVVRRLIQGEEYRRGRVEFVWNGRDDADADVPEGTYQARVRLERQHRTITLPNRIRVDVTPPRVTMSRLAPRVFSPDGDSRSDRVIVGYRVDEAARVSLFVDGTRAVLKKGQKQKGTIDWFGTRAGVGLPQKTYELRLGATDVAGNVSPLSRAKQVVIRYVALGRDRVEASPGASFPILVLSDAARIEWKLGARAGGARPGTLKLRAPLQPGRFTLTVTANGHSARAAVIVREPAP